jgi:hypothetical protein
MDLPASVAPSSPDGQWGVGGELLGVVVVLEQMF